MGNNLEDDLTPEEKALLKREMKHRIEQQRRREGQKWHTGAVVAAGGVATILFAIQIPGPIVGVAASPLAPVILAAGGILVVIGLLLVWFWR